LKTVGIKFCGGCNPTFDRSQYWNEIKALSSGRINWVGFNHSGLEALLLITGCHTSCPEKNFHPADYNLFIVVRDNLTTPASVVEKIISWGKNDSNKRRLHL
jgi:hypothetical protein